MTEFRHDPDSLANRLDQLLPPEQPDRIGTDDDPLIETAARFASAPHPSLSPGAMARIQARLMQKQPTLQRPARLPSLGRLATIAALMVLVVAGTLFAAQELGITLIAPGAAATINTPLNTTTDAPTVTADVTPGAVASETLATPVSPTVSQLPFPTGTGSSTAESPAFTGAPTISTPTESQSPTTTPPPPGTATPTALPVMIIVEGPVQAIESNIITIYNVDIAVDVNEPILSVIQVGDVIRVEGDSVANADTLTVIARSVAMVNLEGFVDLDGTIWRDTGDCSNPPPPSAPAPGWRARCEATGGVAPPPENNGTVVICHHAQGESGQRETIIVGWPAWVNEHSRHGDTLGPCQ